MRKNIKLFNPYATSSLKYANKISLHDNKKTIGGDSLFWGIYQYIKNHQYFDLFCNVTGLTNTEALDEYYNKEIKVDFSSNKTQDGSEELELNDKLKSKIETILVDGLYQLDLIVLFYISFFDLSSQLKNYLSQKTVDISIENIVKSCDNLLENPIIIKSGIFAFLEILDKIFTKLNLDSKNVKIMDIRNLNSLKNVNDILNSLDSEIVEKGDNSESQVGTSVRSTKKEERKMTVDYFGTDLTKEVKDGFMDPIIGREDEINQVIYTLLRKNKNNPLLIGEAGVGKTAIVEGLAQKIVAGDVPEKLKNKKIYLLDMGTLLAGTKYRGEFEARMKSILDEAMDPTNHIILFIDELHTIIGAGGQDNNDAAQMLKPLLARGKIKLIGATTFDEYQKHIEKDAALKRRFQEVIVNEPDGQTAIQIMEGLKQTYEDFHGVSISNSAIKASVKLTKRYMLNKYLPDKALDIIDEACARKSTMQYKLENDEEYKKIEKKIDKIKDEIEVAIENQDYFKAAELKEKEEELKNDILKIRNNKNIPSHLRPTIEKEDIGNVLADKTGIPANVVNQSEIEKLKMLADSLKGQVFGQDDAVQAVVNTLTRNRLSVIEKHKPIGSFLFLGPSGVGKTFLAKMIAKSYFGDESAIVRLDMSEYMEKFSVSKLIGSPAGYVGYDEGGQLTEAIRRKPYSVLLLDEIEKASLDVLNILLQILDEGKLKDSKGRWVDFKSTIIVMTSNLGSEQFSKKGGTIGFSTGETKKGEIDEKTFEKAQERVLEELKDFMSPELINRIDHKIVFKPLSKEVLTDIFKKNLKEFLDSWKANSKAVLPEYTEKEIKEIIDKIYDPQYGARPVERYIHDTIEPEIIQKIMEK
ncbi:MAG TPA: ATP-dependent Clp protease ATP-binding subunit [Candidatus Absconditabacterales bacterium]|nr:ATP-dependent Clp protease ATP-binding subunit [Candidatus Absconditabacterales bacterium]